MKCEHLVDGVDGGRMRVDAEAGGAQGFERLRIAWAAASRRACLSFAMQQEVGVEVQPALRDDVRFERADGAGGGVARVDGGGQALGHALLVHLHERGLRQHDLAAHLEVCGQAAPPSTSRRTRAAAPSGWCARWR